MSNYSLIENITCRSGATSLASCDVLDSCTTTCEITIGIKCYGAYSHDANEIKWHHAVNSFKMVFIFIFHTSNYVHTEFGNCTENAVCLANGAIDQEGRLEICVNGVWGSFCSDGWDQTDGHVLCKQLHLGDGGRENCTPQA